MPQYSSYAEVDVRKHKQSSLRSATKKTPITIILTGL